MVAIGITGVSGLVGCALTDRLLGRPDVSRLVGIDLREPPYRFHGVEFHLADVAHGDLRPLLEGCDVVVHLASIVDPIGDDALMARVNVDGTRRVLEAVSAVGVGKVVRVSTTTVYGAWPGNPVPLTEDAPLRPNPGFSPAIQAAEVERILAEWRRAHPDVVVTILRSGPVLGPGADRLPSRLLLHPPPLRLDGEGPVVQAVHLSDLVSALEHVVREDHPGVFNVVADGWLRPEEIAALVRRPRYGLSPGTLQRVLARSWAAGLGDVPPGVVPYLVHPWVVSNARLRATGWAPRSSNAEAIRAGLAERPPPRRSHRGVVGGAVAAGVTAAWLGQRIARGRRGRARRAT